MATTRPYDDPALQPRGLGARALLGVSGRAAVPAAQEQEVAGYGTRPAAGPADITGRAAVPAPLSLGARAASAAVPEQGGLGLGRRAMNDFDRTPVDTPAGRNLSYDFGTTSPSPVGLGRGVLNPPRASQGPGFTQELSTLPSEMPTGMPSGVIMKTMDANGRPVYSGQNISGDAKMVDGLGRQVQQRGSVNVIGGGGTGSGAYADRQLSLGRAAAMQRGDLDAVRASYGEGPSGPQFTGPGLGASAQRQRRQVSSSMSLGEIIAARQENREADRDQRERLGLAELGIRQLESQNRSLNDQARLGIQRGELGLRGQELADRRAERGPSIMDRLRLQNAQDSYQRALASGDQQQIRQAELALRAVSGQLESPESWRGVELSGGQDAQGNRNPSSLAAVNQRTGEVRMGAGGGGEPIVRTPQDLERLPSGALFRGEDGVLRRKN